MIKLSYDAIFQYDADGICISFPDIPFCLTCAENSKIAIRMAREALELALDGMHISQLPQSTVYKERLSVNQEKVPITVELEIANGILCAPNVKRVAIKKK